MNGNLVILFNLQLHAKVQYLRGTRTKLKSHNVVQLMVSLLLIRQGKIILDAFLQKRTIYLVIHKVVFHYIQTIHSGYTHANLLLDEQVQVHMKKDHIKYWIHGTVKQATCHTGQHGLNGRIVRKNVTKKDMVLAKRLDLASMGMLVISDVTIRLLLKLLVTL